MTSSDRAEPDYSLYDKEYYEDLHVCLSASADVVVPIVQRMLNVESVLDVGCGLGAWLRAFQRLGVDDVVGLDLAAIPNDLLLVDPEVLRAVDLSEPFALGRRFDLAVCVEVAEHLPARSAGTLVESISAHADAVLFSGAVPGQTGVNHVNEQWATYWAELFGRHGYLAFDVLRPRLWAVEEVDRVYRQNLLIFARSDMAERLGGPDAAVRELAFLDIVHPAAFEAEGLRARDGVEHVRSAARDELEAIRASAQREIDDERRAATAQVAELDALRNELEKARRPRTLREIAGELGPAIARSLRYRVPRRR